ncbi:hypothetical protein EBESD8_37260 [Rhodococcus aetherivorans]|nr:hypothetical protein EBESD8_37260 [Rhodococcus aetherivorans]
MSEPARFGRQILGEQGNSRALPESAHTGARADPGDASKSARFTGGGAAG